MCQISQFLKVVFFLFWTDRTANMAPKKKGFTDDAAALINGATEAVAVRALVARQPMNEKAAAKTPALALSGPPKNLVPARDSAQVLPPIPEVDKDLGGDRGGSSLRDEAILPKATLPEVNTGEKSEEKPEAGNVSPGGQGQTTALVALPVEAPPTPSHGLMAPTSTTKSSAAEVFFTKNETAFEKLLSIKTLDDIKPQDYDRGSGKLIVDVQGGKAATTVTQDLLKKLLKNARASEHDDLAREEEGEAEQYLSQKLSPCR